MKIIKKLNPKNYSITTQILLIFFLSFSILVIFFISYTNNSNNKVNEKIENNTNDTVYSFINKNDFSYQSLLSFYNNTNYIILFLDENNELISSANFVKVRIADQYFNVYEYSGFIEINDEINYIVDEFNNIIIVDEKYHSNYQTAIVDDVIYPSNLNFIFSNSAYYHAYKEKNITNYFFEAKIKNINLVIINPNIDYSNIDSVFILYQSVIFSFIFFVFLVLTFIFYYLYANPIKQITNIIDDLKGLDNSRLNTKVFKNKEYTQLSNTFNDLTQSLSDIIGSLNQKNFEITKYNEELSKEYQFKKQLVATISHEIKTPLTSIQAIISGVLDEIFTKDEATKELGVALEEIDNTNNMLQQIVQLYQLEGTDFKLNLRLVDLTSLINDSLKIFKWVASKYNQTIEFSYDESFDVYVDEILMARVVNNIILNAITYSPSNNKVIIKIKKYSSYTLLEVINYGVNIPQDEINKVFNAFYRVDKSRTKSQDHGNGLGLYLVSEALKKHNFDYGIENIANAVRFYIKFDHLENNHND